MDVRIVGGGFAGIVTGLEVLLRDPDGGHRVTVYEARDRVSTTLCGEGLSETTLDRLRIPGFDHAPFIANRFRGAAWYLPNGKHVLVDDPCFTMDRARWIPAMADRLAALGGRIETGRRLSTGDVRALGGDLVVGADGPGSRVRPLVGCKVRQRLGIQYRMAETGYETERLIFVTDKRYSPEYSWIFPRGEVDNVGLLAEEDGQDWERLDRFMARWGVAGRQVRKEAYPIAFNGTKQQAGRYALVGDAGGQTNPVTKGGMAAIVYASEILADTIKEGNLRAYGDLVMAHPIMDASFRRTVEIIEASSNTQLERWSRFLPKSFTAEAREAGPRWGIAIRTIAGNPLAVPSFLQIYRALALSRRYSW